MGPLALAYALLGTTLAGPPALPPLPGQGAPAEDPAPAREPEEPPPKAAPAAKPPAPEVTPTPAPEQPPSEPAPRENDGWSKPEVAEPPQPPASGPAPAPTDDGEQASNGGRAPRPDRGDGAGSIPEGEADGAGMPRLPPPERPPYNGLGLFIAAGATFSIALTEQIVGHVLFKRRCLDPIQRGELHIDDVEESDQFGEVARECAPGVLPALALRVHSDLGLAMTIGFVAGGAAMRANQQAYDDVFGGASRRTMMALRIAGISLLGAGAVTWLSTGAGSWGWQGSCPDARCVGRARVFGFVMRDVSAAMIASGAGMLTWAEVYRKRHNDFTRDKAISVSPSLSRTHVGFQASGRF